MASTSPPTRLDGELFEAAKAAGAVMSRSAAQQIAHWARIGREVEASDSISHRDVAAVLAGSQDYDALPAPEQAVVRAAWSQRLKERIASTDLVERFGERGQSYVELDAGGQVVPRPAPRRRGIAG
jgi:predicted trehalose synthase